MIARRLSQVKPYPFREIAKIKHRLERAGQQVIDFGIGDPDLPTPPHIVEALALAVRDPATHRYDESGFGTVEFREAVAGWFQQRFQVQLDPGHEIQSLIGSKDGLVHLPLAFLGPHQYALAPDPRYVVYELGPKFAGGKVYSMPLRAEAGFLPDLEAIPHDVLRRAKLLFLNYPNNPTGAVADLSLFRRAVDFARRQGLILCHDAAYAEVYFGEPPPSILNVEGAREVALEFHSLSKTFNMTGWRVGFAVGGRELIAALSRLKSYLDSGVFMAVQRAAIAALTGPQECVAQMRRIYRRRRDRLVGSLRESGWQVPLPPATFYVWAPVPTGTTSQQCAERLLTETGAVVIPGAFYGHHGEGFVRFSLTLPGADGEGVLEQAAAKIAGVIVPA